MKFWGWLQVVHTFNCKYYGTVSLTTQIYKYLSRTKIKLLCSHKHKFKGLRQEGPRKRWIDDLEADLKICKGTDWKSRQGANNWSRDFTDFVRFMRLFGLRETFVEFPDFGDFLRLFLTLFEPEAASPQDASAAGSEFGSKCQKKSQKVSEVC